MNRDIAPISLFERVIFGEKTCITEKLDSSGAGAPGLEFVTEESDMPDADLIE